MKQARTIFVSHYHGDHAGAVVVSPDFEELTKKTIICAETARLLVEEDQPPMMGQLRWMNTLQKPHPEIQFLVAHDYKLLGAFEENGLVRLELQFD